MNAALPPLDPRLDGKVRISPLLPDPDGAEPEMSTPEQNCIGRPE